MGIFMKQSILQSGLLHSCVQHQFSFEVQYFRARIVSHASLTSPVLTIHQPIFVPRGTMIWSSIVSGFHFRVNRSIIYNSAPRFWLMWRHNRKYDFEGFLRSLSYQLTHNVCLSKHGPTRTNWCCHLLAIGTYQESYCRWFEFDLRRTIIVRDLGSLGTSWKVCGYRPSKWQSDMMRKVVVRIWWSGVRVREFMSSKEVRGMLDTRSLTNLLTRFSAIWQYWWIATATSLNINTI
jgi:hypothetical protein